MKYVKSFFLKPLWYLACYTYEPPKLLALQGLDGKCIGGKRKGNIYLSNQKALEYTIAP